MLKQGQYRRVRYSDDGCDIYQCMWCKRTVEIRDNPDFGWNFCPKCGKSWFKRLMCRPNTVPRWYWDYFGDPEADHTKPAIWELMPEPAKPTKQWVIECRQSWLCPHTNADWGDWDAWSVVQSIPKKPFESDYMYVYRLLRQMRACDEDREFVRYQYRVRLVEKHR